MIVRVGVVSFVIVMASLGASSAEAQSSEQTLSQLLPDLLRSTVTLAPPDSPNIPSHQAHFLPTDADNIYQVPNQFNGALLASLTTFPLGSSSGGFVFEGDPALGDFRPASRSYGPTFAERALTSGRGNVNFGVAFQAAHYDSFEGKELDAGDIKFYLRHQDCCAPIDEGDHPDPAFEGDIIETSVTLKIRTSATTFLFNYGMTDRWDVGVAVPIVNVSLEAGVLARVDRIATGVGNAAHQFPGTNHDEHAETRAGNATGLGDLVLRTKYRVSKTPGGGLAVGLDLRLPSGNEEELLGLGTPQAKFTVIGSTEAGPFGPHMNLSYALAGESNLEGIDIPSEFGYTFGLDAVAHNVTFAFDLIGRTLLNAGRFRDVTRTFPLLNTPSVNRTEFGRRDGDLNQLLGVAGVKIPVMDKLLITANGLFSLKDAGLKAKFIPVIGLEYVFPRQ